MAEMTVAHPVPVRKVQWRRAWRALRELIADAERTDKVIEFLNCIGGSGDLRAFARFQRDPEGARLLAERPSLLKTMSDLDTLSALPAGSFGRAYADFMRGEKLDPDGIVAEFAKADTTEAIGDEDMMWFFERLDVMHDIWHVLTGYGRDRAGEAANLAFTFGQFPTRGVGLLALAGVIIGPKDITFAWQRYLGRAWLRGRRASWLLLARYEDLLALPLEEVRRRLRIEPAMVAHPEGILVSNELLSEQG